MTRNPPRAKTPPPKPAQKIPTDLAVELIREVAESYTRHHRDLHIEAGMLSSAIQITVQANRDDHPKLVGSQGKHVWALQLIASLMGGKAGIPIRLTLLEPIIGDKGQPARNSVPDPTWKPNHIENVIRRILAAALPPLRGEDHERRRVDELRDSPRDLAPGLRGGRTRDSPPHARGRKNGGAIRLRRDREA